MPSPLIHPDKNILLLCNPRAGKGSALAVAEGIRQRLQALAIPHQYALAEWPDQIDRFSEIWLVGGDGTLNYFINRYPGITQPLALFKGGSGNDFAWKLYGNRSWQEHFDQVLAGSRRRIDAGHCNGRLFLNGAGIGFDGEVVKAMGQKRFLSASYWAYLAVVLRRIFYYKETRMTVTTQGGRVEGGRLFLVTVANGSRYGGGFLVAPLAEMDDGLLDIVLVSALPVIKRLYYLPVMTRGRHLHLSFTRYFRDQALVIETDRPVCAHLDGELHEGTRFEIRIRPGEFTFLG